MELIIAKTICLLVFIGAAVGATDSANAAVIDVEELNPLKDPKCIIVELLVDLPIIEDSFETQLSSTHAFVKRCVGVNDDKKACITKDPEIKIEHWSVTKATTGSNKEAAIHVSWVAHETCRYTKRKCKIEEARACHEKSATHYYDEINCTCLCIVQIDGEETCKAIIKTPPSYSASTTVIWLPILSFILGMGVCALFLFFKNRRTGDHKYDNVSMANGHNETGVSTAPSQGIGFDHGGIEHPADPPTQLVTNKGGDIGFNV